MSSKQMQEVLLEVFWLNRKSRKGKTLHDIFATSKSFGTAAGQIMNSGQKVVEFEDIFYLPVLGFIGT